MKQKLLVKTGIASLLLVTTLPLFAATPRIDLLGDPASPSAATRTIVIKPDTRYVNVTGGDIVKFVSGDKTFAWNFDGGENVGSFALNEIAPPGTLDHRIMAYVTPNPRYMGGGM
jgi:hypothetical protein